MEEKLEEVVEETTQETTEQVEETKFESIQSTKYWRSLPSNTGRWRGINPSPKILVAKATTPSDNVFIFPIIYFISLCNVWLLQLLQYFFNSIRFGVLRLFFFVKYLDTPADRLLLLDLQSIHSNVIKIREPFYPSGDFDVDKKVIAQYFSTIPGVQKSWIKNYLAWFLANKTIFSAAIFEAPDGPINSFKFSFKCVSSIIKFGEILL